MKRIITIVLLLLLARGLAAQGATIHWEYAKLSVVNNHPFIWSAGDRDSVLAEPQATAMTEGTNKEFLAFLNLVGGQGWELITVDLRGGGATYLFKRRRP